MQIFLFLQTYFQPDLLYQHPPTQHRLERMEAFYVTIWDEKRKQIVDLVANRGSFERNYCGRILIPGSYLRRGTEVA